MATHIRDNTAIDTAVEIVDAIAAGLAADPETADLAVTWTALVTRGDALAAALRAARRLARRARARVGVHDVLWDVVMKAFEREVLAFVQGNRALPAYQMFFRAVTANEATRYGIDREVGFARTILPLIAAGGSGSTAFGDPWHDRLGAATDTLDASSQARREAVVAIGPFLTAQYLFVEDVNLDLDRLEGELQIRFPGQPKRVAAYLAATRRDDAGVPDAAPAPSPDPTPTGG